MTAVNSRALVKISDVKLPNKAMFYDVFEHTPTDDKFYWCYSEVFGTYHVAKYSPVNGWCDMRGNFFKAITHWLDFQMPMPFEMTDEVNQDLAKKLGLKVDDRFRFS